MAFFQNKQYIFTITITDFSEIILEHTVLLELIDHPRVCVNLQFFSLSPVVKVTFVNFNYRIITWQIQVHD